MIRARAVHSTVDLLRNASAPELDQLAESIDLVSIFEARPATAGAARARPPDPAPLLGLF